jgi:hypothetical protein
MESNVENDSPAVDEKSTNIVTVWNIDASKTFYDLIWKHDSTKFTQLNILDSIVTSKDDGIRKWLFTSNDGIDFYFLFIV